MQTATTLRASLAVDALEMAPATRRRRNCQGLVHHSDGETQTQTMSGNGNGNGNDYHNKNDHYYHRKIGLAVFSQFGSAVAVEEMDLGER